MGKTVMMSAITGNTRIEFGLEGMFLGLKCGEIRGQNVEYSKRFFGVQLPRSYSCTWHLRLNGKMCYGKAVISASALEVVQRQHRGDLLSRLQYTTMSFLCLDWPRYCAEHSVNLGKASV